MRDSESGLERLAIGHHIGERGHVMERSRNRRTGDREERQDFINLEESESLRQKEISVDGDPLFLFDADRAPAPRDVLFVSLDKLPCAPAS